MAVLAEETEKDQEDGDDDDLPDGQNPNWEAELQSGDPFAIAEEMERSIPRQNVQSMEADANDPFRDISLFRVSVFFLKN